MFWWIYEFILWMALFITSPYYLLRMKRRGGYARDFLERFGIFDRSKRELLRGTNPIWIHAVSVGEVDLALQLISKLRSAFSEKLSLVLSTTTSTGHALAKRKLPPQVPLFYYPLDSRLCFGRVHHLLSPKAFVLIEAELWPNHLRFCGQKKVPLILVNARISERFYPRYHKFRSLFAPAFRSFQQVTLQSNHDLERLIRLGFSPEALTIVGNLKYDTARSLDEHCSQLTSALSIFRDRLMWVAGSTHQGEEEIVLDIFKRLRRKYPKLLLGLAPRHAERTAEISTMMKRDGISYVLRSELGAQPNPSNKDVEVLLLDTTGELKHLYEHAWIIFVGKSMKVHGGQNIIESAVCGKPVLFGPYMENFKSIVQDFLEAKAAIQIQDASELESKLQFLLENPDARTALGERALQLVRSKQGGMERTIAAIQKALLETK